MTSLNLVLKTHRTTFTTQKNFQIEWESRLHQKKLLKVELAPEKNAQTSRSENRFRNDIKEQGSSCFYTILLRVLFGFSSPFLSLIFVARSMHEQRFHQHVFIERKKTRRRKKNNNDLYWEKADLGKGAKRGEEKLRNMKLSERQAHAESERRTWTETFFFLFCFDFLLR